MKFLFAFIELLVVINSSYSLTPRSSYTLSRYRPYSAVIRQCETPALKNGSVRLKQRGKLVRYTCSSTFTLLGDRYSSCINGQWENPVPMCIKPGCPAVVAPENGFVVVERNGAVIMLFCRQGYIVAGSQQTYCNGYTWDRSLGSCRETHTSPAMSCDFEDSTLCGWEAGPDQNFEWIRKNGYTSVKRLQTGPHHDNTIGVPLEGHFMLATFAAQAPQSVTRLISPLYPAEAGKDACFRFFYHMYGASTGVLRVYIKPESLSISDILDSPKYLYVEKKGSYENAWLESVFDIDENEQDFQIIIEATAMRTTLSNIAIDDVALMRGADCTNEELMTTAVTTEEDGIFDAQSCVNRCQETAPYSRYVTESTLTNENKTVLILQCDCYDGCVDRMSCCLDYRSVCVFDFPTMDSADLQPYTEIPLSTPSSQSTPSSTISTLSTPTTTSIRTPKSTTTLMQTTTIKSTTKTIPTTKIPVTRIPTTTKIPTTKTITTAKSISTTKIITTPLMVPSTPVPPIPTTVKLTTRPSTTISTTIRTTSKTTTKNVTPRKIITPTTTTKKPTITTKQPTTVPTIKSTVPITTTRIYNTTTVAETKSINEKLAGEDVPRDTDPLTNNLLHIFGVILFVVVITALTITSFKLYEKYQNNYFNYKSKSQDASDERSDTLTSPYRP